MNLFGRQIAAQVNEMKHSLGALVGIAQGLLCDQALSDSEILFLNDWFKANISIATSWPGDVILMRLRAVMADGIITEVERGYLVQTLQQLVGGSLDDLAALTHVTQLAFDDVSRVKFAGAKFCLTGQFVYGPRESCEALTQHHGGIVTDGVTKKLNYLVVGGLGSIEWKHGSFGLKIEKAILYKRQGLPLLIVHEDCWASSL